MVITALLFTAAAWAQYQVVPDWPNAPRTAAGTPSAWNFIQVPGVAVDARGDVLVLHRGAHPVMVFDAKGELHSVIGSALGSVIINFVAKTLVATLDWKMDMQAAIASPHFGSRGGPVELERGTPVENLQGALRSMGHEVRVGDLPSGLHGISNRS